MTDAEALAEIQADVEFKPADAEDVLHGLQGTKRPEAVRVATADVHAYARQLRVLQRCKVLLEAEDGAQQPLAAE